MISEASWPRVTSVLLALVGVACLPSSSEAQMSGGGRPLGGYGASAMSRPGGGSGTMVPYLGGQGGFVPYRKLEPMRRSSPQFMPTPIGGSSVPMTLGLGRDMAGDRDQFPRMGGLLPMGPSLLPAPMTRRSSAPRQLGPGFGYPFRRPPPPIGAGPAMGPSM